MQARRILLINHEYPPLGGSAGNATRHIAKALARLGHKPFVLTAASSGLRINEEDDGVTIRRIPTWYSAGVNADDKPSGAAQGTAFLFAALRAAPRLAREWKIDIALCFFGLPGGPLGLLLKRRLGIPYIIALQGGDVPAPEIAQQGAYRRMVSRGLNYLWRQAGAVIAHSDRLAEEARAHDLQTPIAVIPYGADTHGITPKEDYAPQGDVSLLYVGRLAEQRGFDVLLPALAMLSSALKWKLTLAGDGPDWPNVAASAARLALIDRIDLRGWQGWSVLPELYRSADVFVLPSYDEGMPAALLEAMATGLPVVSTHVAGRGEAVLHEKTGLLVPPQNTEALADALTQMIADPSRWETFGRAGRARVEFYYSWTKVAEQWVETMERVLQKA